MRKYYGKEKCRILKQVRAKIAKENDIEWIVEECPHKGDCLGTCPKCEAEVRELEKKLESRRRAGLTVALAGVAAGVALTVSGCALPPAENSGGPAAGGSAADGKTAADGASAQTSDEAGVAVLEGEILDDGSRLTITDDDVFMGDVAEPLQGEPAYYPDTEEDTADESADADTTDGGTVTAAETSGEETGDQPLIMGMMAAPDDGELE